LRGGAVKVGRFRETIVIERREDGAVGSYGTPAFNWVARGTVRAELVADGQADAPAASAGVKLRRVVTFRIRAFGGVSARDRVVWKGVVLTVLAVKAGDFDAGAGLDLECEAVT